MSLDIEELARWYRQQFDDEDIAEMLENASRVSRRRGRPERVLEQNAALFEKKGLTPQEYFLLQQSIMKVFMKIAPPGVRKQDHQASLVIFQKFHDERGKDIDGATQMRDLLMPGYHYVAPLAYDQRQELRLRMERIHPAIKERWNRTIYMMSSGFQGLIPLSYYRDMADDQILDIKNIADKSLQIFRTALQ